MTTETRRLSVRVDGAPMPADEAVAMWGRFSAYMEAHKGDLAGFAAQEGFASVKPSFDASGAVLLLSTSAPQVPYANAKGLGAPEKQARERPADAPGQTGAPRRRRRKRR